MRYIKKFNGFLNESHKPLFERRGGDVYPTILKINGKDTITVNFGEDDWQTVSDKLMTFGGVRKLRKVELDRKSPKNFMRDLLSEYSVNPKELQELVEWALEELPQIINEFDEEVIIHYLGENTIEDSSYDMFSERYPMIYDGGFEEFFKELVNDLGTSNMTFFDRYLDEEYLERIFSMDMDDDEEVDMDYVVDYILQRLESEYMDWNEIRFWFDLDYVMSEYKHDYDIVVLDGKRQDSPKERALIYRYN